MSKIKDIRARQVLDSRGNPTLEVEIHTQGGSIGMAPVPSGASRGKYEAAELRDDDKEQYLGQGVQKSVGHVTNILKNALVGYSVFEQGQIDNLMIALDGTTNKSKLGANTLLGVSLAVTRAAAQEAHMPLYRYIGGIHAHLLPTPMINILNGGVHAHNALDIQEFMIVPVKANSFAEALRMGVEVFHHLGKLLYAHGLATNLGDEGGFAPDISSHEKAIEYILKAIEKAGYRPGEDIFLALDAATSTLFDPQTQCYRLQHATGQPLSSEAMVELWKEWIRKYPILSIEDGMAEDDWAGWRLLTAAIGSQVQLVGDDLFATNVARLQKGIDTHAANAVLVKMNQVGTLTETLAAVQLAHQHGYKSIISHRSGETEDSSIADLAVALNTRQIKAGGPSRSDRTAKYNRLLRIEEALGSHAQFAGRL